ncbi:MAG TPA: hypothetical protein VHH33_04990 [Nitrososphaeraceae archaeon]|nr:hypothetical protein [Nitrososphaeraceae archaeon]
MQKARGLAFIMKEMVKHLVNLVFVQVLIIFIVRKRTKSGAEYNIKLIGQPTNYFKISAAAIGILFWVISILIVFVFTQNGMILIAAVFISLGTGRQIFASALDVVTTNLNAFLSSWASTLLLLAKNRMMVTTTDWRSIESRVELILISRRLEYNLPVKLDGVKPESQQILLEYLDEHKWELEYQQAITNDDSSCLAFFHYATKQLREKLQIYDELEELQERSGGVNAVILMALGVLIWLIS